MHYYQFNIGDYAKDTRHLSNLEDLAYRRLIELYYDTEKPLCGDVKKLSRLVRMSEDIESIESVLSDFFENIDDCFYHKRIESDIAQFQAKVATAKVNGAKGGRPKKTQKKPNGNPEETPLVNLANPEETPLKPNQEPRTKNQEPKTKYNIPYGDIVSFLNKKTGKSYKVTTPKTREVIKARFNDGFSLEDFKTVISQKTESWLNDPAMCKYLRPETLFGNKFEGYLNEGVKKKGGDGWY